MADPLRIILCEDTKADEEKLLALLERLSTPTAVTVCRSGEELLAVYRPQAYDLLLTDIYMGGITGIDAVAKIREIDDRIPVAFITTSTDFALESYRLSALKYIEKPFKEKDIREMLELALMKRDRAPALVLRQNGTPLRLPYAQILYLEQQTHQVNICLQSGTVERIHEKLSSLLPQLEENGFFQPHKSFAVNLSFIRSIDQELKCFVMQDGRNIPIRRESMSQARQALKDHLFSQTRGGGYEA